MTAVPLSSYSRFHQRIARRYSCEAGFLPPGVPTRERIEQTLTGLCGHGLQLGPALRVVRHLCLQRLVEQDCDNGAPLADVVGGMTALAEVCLQRACNAVMQDLQAQHGVPRDEGGNSARMWVIGMGKLGARELNVSSDIDLIYVYDRDGETSGQPDGRGRISNHEYFGRAVRALYALVGETTEHGCVFRIDLALRPNGNSGPPAVSLAALEEYFQEQGREWERFAWLKSRVVATLGSVDTETPQTLRAAILPFVFRRYLDYGVFEALRTLHKQIREHAARRSTGRPERANDVKLSRGGIREIEFIVQLLQVVRGGQYPELRTRGTLAALQRLQGAWLMAAATMETLSHAYVFLRRLEHRIQYLDDQQTHVLPTQDDDLIWLAQSMQIESVALLLDHLATYREQVAQEFDALLGGADSTDCNHCQRGDAGTHTCGEGTADVGGSVVQDRLRVLLNEPRVQALREVSRERLTRLLGRTTNWLRDGEATEAGVLRLIDWIEPLLRRESYLALLLERPPVHQRLLRVLGAARWPARYLMQHPGVIDELASAQLLDERFEPPEFERDLEARRRALCAAGADDDESLLDLLRRAHHAEVFRTLVRDVEGRLTVEQVADDLSALADAVLRVSLRWCWERLRQRHREVPQIAILAYGKLGGKELGYGSDLDIVFVYDDDHDAAQEVYAALVRKLINWLTVKTGEGDLYEIDTELRPNGNSGLLVTTYRAYEDYQLQRGSNTAWTWEHQAMTRARFCAGAASLSARFDAVRRAVLAAPRDASSLAQEILNMRQRVRTAHPVRGEEFDVKHSPGGMVDAEFALQYLVLLHSGSQPTLLDNFGTIALLKRSEELGLLPDRVGQAAADAYRALRKAQHAARLNEEPTQCPPEVLASEQSAIRALWQVVFPQDTA